jgi:hypothetical protein
MAVLLFTGYLIAMGFAFLDSAVIVTLPTGDFSLLDFLIGVTLLYTASDFIYYVIHVNGQPTSSGQESDDSTPFDDPEPMPEYVSFDEKW